MDQPAKRERGSLPVWACLTLALGSPIAVASLVIAVSARRAAEVGAADSTIALVGAGFAVLGTVVGVLSAPDTGRRSVMTVAVIYGVLSVVAYAVVLGMGCRYIYFQTLAS